MICTTRSFNPSCPRFSRASTAFRTARKLVVDGRNKSGHDDVRASFKRGALPRMALGDAINLLLHRAGVGVEGEGDGRHVSEFAFHL